MSGIAKVGLTFSETRAGFIPQESDINPTHCMSVLMTLMHLFCVQIMVKTMG